LLCASGTMAMRPLALLGRRKMAVRPLGTEVRKADGVLGVLNSDPTDRRLLSARRPAPVGGASPRVCALLPGIISRPSHEDAARSRSGCDTAHLPSSCAHFVNMNEMAERGSFVGIRRRG